MTYYSGTIRSYRRLGTSDLWISPVALGCWPMAGISSLDVRESECMATIEAALELGINHFDTAYSYGYNGEADRYLAHARLCRFPHVVVGTKVGSYYDSSKERKFDARPETLKRHACELLKRLRMERLDLLYLHTPDGITPIEQSAEALADLQRRDLVRFVGLSNASPEETLRFSKVVRPVVLQPPFNMLQQETFDALRPICKQLHCGAAVYWPLMKGLLSGTLKRDHAFDERDRRKTYPMFQGLEWQRNQDFLDRLRTIATESGLSVAQLVVRWTLEQSEVTTVLCGARKPKQIIESVSSIASPLSRDAMAQIEHELKTLDSI